MLAYQFNEPYEILTAVAGFSGRITMQGLGDGVMLTRVRSDGSVRTVPRNRPGTRTMGNDLLIFDMHLGGGAHVRHYGEESELTAGTALLYEGRGPWELTTTRDGDDLLLQFPRGMLPLRAGEITESCARVLDLRAPALQVLTGHLEWLESAADDLSARQRADGGRAALDMLTTILQNAETVAAEEQVRIETLQAYVLEHLADPGLTTVELARRHRISHRQVYRLFAGTATTPSAFIRDQRLRAAQSILTDPRSAELAISTIAESTGFVEVRTFERAFRRAFGLTPAAWRQTQ
ncbi:helix-turn-helix domain-containing protein [Actinoplanes sp. TBRC 11911]|uniref:helix-turn-helix domain-containing protein n=1 Tax=Actinoplanes sp. TBRC 11911 TaxID=2729386 RepID=UPI00145EE58E|nr:helix-turn-helix domain-containing protein [Actinoplanes sp. TBRC 11911]NMO55705.1 helix-turn-helix domain-containing protein [Actinoplanes sp. TBRC 11911]